MKVNTKIGEQTFSQHNSYKQTKQMNAYRYIWFFTYYMDLHNLEMNGRLHEIHPKYTKEIKTTKLFHLPVAQDSQMPQSNLNKVLPDEPKVNAEETEMLKANKDPSIQDITIRLAGVQITNNSENTCTECKKTYKSEKGLKQHLWTIHQIDPEKDLRKFKCHKCDKGSKANNQLARHLKTTKCAKQ